MENIYVKGTYHTDIIGTDNKLTYPAGIGVFREALISYGYSEAYTLENHLLKLIDPNIVYCMGCSYFDPKGINLELIGLLLK